MSSDASTTHAVTPAASVPHTSTDASPAAASSSPNTTTDASNTSAAGSPKLAGTDSLTKMMIDKSIQTLATHKALAHRGLAILYRNLFAILFGPNFAQSWENTIMREEQKSTAHMFVRTNVESRKRLKVFFESKKQRAKTGSCLSIALINPSSKTESFEHRMLLIWLGQHLFKIDGMKRSGVPGFTTETLTWPAALTDLTDQGTELYAALQVLCPDKIAKCDWDAEKQRAWDVMVGRPTGSVPFGSAVQLQGKQTFCIVTNDEEGLAVDLKNGLVERLKAITMQLESMQ